MNKTIHVRRTIEITVSVPVDETQEVTEQWLDDNLIPNCSLEEVDADHVIKDIRLAGNDDDQDDFLVVEWPASQELMEYEGFMDNCTLLLSDGFGSASYLVNKHWYGKLHSGQLQKTDYQEAA
jgi:hypothetical protein